MHIIFTSIYNYKTVIYGHLTVYAGVQQLAIHATMQSRQFVKALTVPFVLTRWHCMSNHARMCPGLGLFVWVHNNVAIGQLPYNARTVLYYIQLQRTLILLLIHASDATITDIYK